MILLEPGPLRLFTEDEIPVSHFEPTLEAIAVEHVRALEDGAAALELAHNDLATATAPPLDAAELGDVAGSVDVLARQAADAAQQLAGVVANVDGLDATRGGLANEIAADLNLPPIGDITFPDEPDTNDTDRDVQRWDATTRAAFRRILNRNATNAEVRYARIWYPDEAAERDDWIARGGLSSSAPPTPTPPAPTDPAALIAHYRARLADWIRANFHREPEENELADIDRVVAIHGTINDELFDQLIAQNYRPRL